MESIFEPYEPDQVHLLPPAPRDWVGEGHLAHFISDTVDQLDLAPFLKKYAGRASGKGQKAYHPAMMLKVLIYAYCVGIFSSRKIMAALTELVPLRYLAAGNYPGHRTIARFREKNLSRFRSVFVEVVRITIFGSSASQRRSWPANGVILLGRPTPARAAGTATGSSTLGSAATRRTVRSLAPVRSATRPVPTPASFNV